MSFDDLHMPCAQCGASMPSSQRAFCPGRHKDDKGKFDGTDCENGICNDCRCKCSRCGHYFCSDCVESIDDNDVCHDCLTQGE